MNILSLFDGISCGQIALNRAGIKVENYFASEIDKYTIKVTQHNYPNTIQIGEVSKVKGSDLPKIDLLIGGSPCQGFSFAGKNLNFKDPRSFLFFEYVRLLKECTPKYFLFENVKMKKESEEIITRLLGVKALLINSNLVSAQNRKRLYWTNIPVVGLPKDLGLLLKDVIEHGYIDRDKSYCVDANYFKCATLDQYLNKSRRQIIFEKPHGFNKGGFVEKDKFNTLRACSKDNYAILDKSMIQINPSKECGGKQPYLQNRVYDPMGISPAICAQRIHKIPFRKLLPVECERLQTLPEGYTDCGISNTQRYKAIGNCWTVDVIAWIFGFIKEIEIEHV